MTDWAIAGIALIGAGIIEMVVVWYIDGLPNVNRRLK